MHHLASLLLLCAAAALGRAPRAPSAKSERSNAPPVAAAAAKPTWAAVLVDNRFDAGVMASIGNARRHIPELVPIYCLVSGRVAGAAFEATADMPNVHILNARYEGATVVDYNKLLLSEAFWRQFEEEYLLVFQRDSRFCSNSTQRVEDWVGRYDYVGAPWPRPVLGQLRVGNGGFSMRSRAAMLRCTLSGELRRGLHEDVAFAYCLTQDGGNLPTVEVAADFAVESYRPADRVPLGVHALWRHLPHDLFLARHCPEGVRV